MNPRPKNPTTAYGVRMPVDLVAKIKQLAKQENRSFNGQAVQLLNEAIEARRCRPATAREAGTEKEEGGER